MLEVKTVDRKDVKGAIIIDRSFLRLLEGFEFDLLEVLSPGCNTTQPGGTAALRILEFIFDCIFLQSFLNILAGFSRSLPNYTT